MNPTFLFWSTLFFILYTYIGYPVILWILAKVSEKPISKADFNCWPMVSIVIAAKDEEINIKQRLENLLAQQYPGMLEVIIVSDGSTDETVKVAEGYQELFASKGRQLHIVEYYPSKGKPTALNRGMEIANGEITVFGDCRQRYARDAVKELVRNFSDCTVGAVSGELLFLEDHESAIRMEMGAYWNYEKAVRSLESKSGSVIGVTGAIYAIRSQLFRPIPSQTILDDVLIPMDINNKGFRILFDGKAKAYDILSKELDKEWQRKVRTLAGNWQLISVAPWLFLPTYKDWWRFISHKVCRIFIPFVLPIFYIASFWATGPIYKIFAVLQTLFYFTAFITAKAPTLQRMTMLRFLYFFCVLNLAALEGFAFWITGKATKTWQRSQNRKK